MDGIFPRAKHLSAHFFFSSTLLETSRNFLLLAREEVEKKPWQMQLA